MIIQLKTLDADGNLVFEGKLNQEEASFVLNVGINYLMAEGAMPSFTGEDDETEEHDIHEAPAKPQ